MADIPTPFGPIPSAPPSADAPTVLLWLVTALSVSLTIAVVMLWRHMQASAQACRAENAAAREAAAAAQDKTEKLYQAALAEVGKRESRLIECVERNTAALHAIEKHVGSGYYKALHDERNKAERGDDPHSKH